MKKNIATLFIVFMTLSINGQQKPSNYSLKPIGRKLTIQEASHLARRSMMEPTYSQILNLSEKSSATEAVDSLLKVPKAK